MYPGRLKEQMQKCVDFSEPIRKDVKTFTARLSVEKTSCQVYGLAKTAPNRKHESEWLWTVFKWEQREIFVSVKNRR